MLLLSLLIMRVTPESIVVRVEKDAVKQLTLKCREEVSHTCSKSLEATSLNECSKCVAMQLQKMRTNGNKVPAKLPTELSNKKSACAELELFGSEKIEIGPALHSFCGFSRSILQQRQRENADATATTRKEGSVRSLSDAAMAPMSSRLICENEIDATTCSVEVASGRIQGCVQCVEQHKQKITAGLIPGSKCTCSVLDKICEGQRTDAATTSVNPHSDSRDTAAEDDDHAWLLMIAGPILFIVAASCINGLCLDLIYDCYSRMSFHLRACIALVQRATGLGGRDGGELAIKRRNIAPLGMNIPHQYDHLSDEEDEGYRY